jgi:molybdopterin molybdotransferase
MSERTKVSEHSARVDALMAPLRDRHAEEVPLARALGRVTAAEVVSPISLPPFRNSQMDGFAVRAADVAGATEDAPVALPIAREIAAAPGDPGALDPGTAIRIMTGAPVPGGADAVIPVEDTTADAASVSIRVPRGTGEYVREAGSDLAAGAVLLPAGTRLAPRHIAALAAAGLDTVDVRTRVKVAVISTGSELVDPGAALGPGQIPDANGAALSAAVQAVGADLILTARVTDQPAELAAILDEAVDQGVELVLTSGGISMGEHEVVRELLEPLGAHVDVLAMQPGGPQALATYRGIPVVCFPGNPVSSQLSFELFVAPLLRELAGLPAPRRETRRLAGAVQSAPGKRQLLRGRRLEGDRVATVSGPGSHLVAALAASDVIIDIPEAVVDLAAGDSVETWEL